MQTLKLADDLFPSLRNGTKKITIRTGHRSIYRKRELLFESVGGAFPPVVVMVTHVMHTTVEHCPDWAFREDGFTSRDDMLEQMKRFYPDISIDSNITIIEFEGARW